MKGREVNEKKRKKGDNRLKREERRERKREWEEGDVK